MAAVIAAIGSRRRELSAQTDQQAGKSQLVAAQRQLDVLGSTLDGFDADARLVDGAAVLLVRHDRAPSIGSEPPFESPSTTETLKSWSPRSSPNSLTTSHSSSPASSKNSGNAALCQSQYTSTCARSGTTFDTSG